MIGESSLGLCLFKKMQVSKLASKNNNPENILVQPYLYGLFKNTGYNRLLNELGWDTLDDRRKLSRFMFV